MTKKGLAELIVDVVINSNGSKLAQENVEALLDTLEPKDRVQFSQWGYPNQRATLDKCWDLIDKQK